MAVMYYHNGSGFVIGTTKVWSGSVWLITPAFYNGVAWIPLYPEGVAETVSLSGTTGTPNNCYDVALSPADATAQWFFQSDGTVDRDTISGSEQFNAGTEWCNVTPAASYWIRFTYYSGTTPDIGTLNTWLALTSLRSFGWEVTGIGIRSGIVKVEISTDVSGSPIVATGYYGGSAEVEP